MTLGRQVLTLIQEPNSPKTAGDRRSIGSNGPPIRNDIWQIVGHVTDGVMTSRDPVG